MKVSEAKKKICPFRSNGIGGIDYMTFDVFCICGDCMAWKYTKVSAKADEGYCQRLQNANS